MFTLEIGGKAIAITDAGEGQARELFGSEDFKDDLLALESGGRPLWDGEAALTVRRSSDAEIETFDDAVSGDEDDEDDSDEDDGINVLLLVPVDNIESGHAVN